MEILTVVLGEMLNKNLVEFAFDLIYLLIFKMSIKAI